MDIPFDLRRHLPRWASKALGMPGSTGFDKIARPEALARISQAAQKTLGYEPREAQLTAATALHEGFAVEQDTGEGKTLVGALAAALFALEGRKVHVLSVNDYLAERDAQWMRPLFETLGIEVAWVTQLSSHEERQSAYRAPIVYAPVSEVGYDVLRDRQVENVGDRVDPARDVAIVDEADAVMIDEAMTPLVLAGTADTDAEDVTAATRLAARLREGEHFSVDEDRSTVSLTDAGIDAAEAQLDGINLFDEAHAPTLTRLNLALHARALVHRDVDYLVADDSIRLINTARGRIAQQQRWPDGLHAAVEAKEGLPITPPGVILDSITVQDLLGGYRTLSGMSGTILPVAEELLEFYQLRSGRVERHRPLIRNDHPPQAFPTAASKTEEVLAEVLRRHDAGQPVLVGTQSVAESEELADRLPESLAARVLNARNDAAEAEVVARAGEPGAVTISTQISGRGTDILLGGVSEAARDEVVAAGGLAVIATGLYPSQRLDQQLRGRAGRQGDPGESLVFASVEDELVVANATGWALRQAGRGRIPAEEVVRESQQIAESTRLERHRGTWEYSRAIAQQRTKVLTVRDDVLISPTSAERTLRLFFLDEEWQEHLAMLTEVRDGIHLRVLAGQNPAEEFHRIALREFAGFFDRVDERVRDALAQIAEDEDPLEALGLKRPSATWTYMMRDNPLGDGTERAAKAVRRVARGIINRLRRP